MSKTIKLPNLPEGWTLKAMWVDGQLIRGVVEKDKQVMLFYWDGISKNPSQFYLFEKYESK